MQSNKNLESTEPLLKETGVAPQQEVVDPEKKAIDAWFANCSYYRCNSEDRRALASLGWNVENELKGKYGIQLQLGKEYFKTPKPLSAAAKLKKAIKENSEKWPYLEDAEVEDAEVEDSEVEDAEVVDSEVEDSEVEDFEVEDFEVEDAEVEDAEVEDAEVEDAEVEDAENIVDPVNSGDPMNPRHVNFAEDNYNNSTWLAFELDLKMGLYHKSPITILLMENIPLENMICSDALLEKIRNPLLQTLKIELSSEDDQDSAKLKIEKIIQNNYDVFIKKLIANHQIEEKEINGKKCYQKIVNITAVDDSDTVFSRRRKSCLQATLKKISPLTTPKLVKTLRTTMARQLVGSFSRESTRPLRRDGKLRTFKKKPLEGVSISVEPEKVEIELSKHYEASSSMTSIILKERPEALEQIGRTLAKTKFEQMNTHKVKTLLFAYVATFLEIPLNSKELLESCNVTYDRALRRTLDRDLKTLLDEISGVIPDDKPHVITTFLMELKTLVLEWAQSHIPSVLTHTISKPATKEKNEVINL